MPVVNLKATSLANQPTAQQIVRLFDETLGRRYNTRLVAGGFEPEYLPADERCASHRIIFSHDYVASALHEIAHWCIAGFTRRLLPDYGYWYVPDGRNHSQQQAFEAVEVKPQALEWLFANACGVTFRVSVDNVGEALAASPQFKQAIVEQARHYCQRGLNNRASAWLLTLSHRYRITDAMAMRRYRLHYLD